MNIYLSHGKVGSPRSVKMSHLSTIAKKLGFTTHVVDYTDTKDPQNRTDKLKQLLKKETLPFLLLGSSMGGYVSIMNASKFERCQGVFLYSPALYMSHYPNNVYTPKTDNIVIVHGNRDQTVPFSHSQKFAEHFPCELHEFDDEHRMEATLAESSKLFEQFLLQTKAQQLSA